MRTDLPLAVAEPPSPPPPARRYLWQLMYDQSVLP